MAPPSRPLAGLTFSLAGAGRVGSSLACWAATAGARAVEVSWHATEGRATELAGRLGARAVPLAELASGGQDLLLVAVADPALAAVAVDLARRPQAAVALHTAGARGASALAPLAAAGCRVGSLHPLKAFPRSLPDPAEGRGVFFAVDGDEEARRLAGRLATAWGGVAGEVPEGRRDLYHLGAWLSAGGVTTLLASSARIAGEAGLPPEVVGGYLELARGALAAAAAEVAAGGTPAAAITGPVVRGDEETVARQLDRLAAELPEMLPLVAAVARGTLDRAAESEPLDEGRRRLADRLARMLGF